MDLYCPGPIFFIEAESMVIIQSSSRFCTCSQRKRLCNKAAGLLSSLGAHAHPLCLPTLLAD
jgi:hypothetical protein